MALAARILVIRNSRWKAALYIPLTIVLGILIFLGLFGFIILLLPFFLFAIPYWFGERSIRRMAWAGPVATIGVVAILALVNTNYVFGSAIDVQRSADGKLNLGTVSPSSGTPNATPFNFTVFYNSTVAPAHAPKVNISSISLSAISFDNYTMALGEVSANGSRYFYTTTLDKSIHVFHFALQRSNGSWIETRDVRNSDAFAIGPFTASYFDFFSYYFVFYILRYFLFALVLFYAILGIYAWHRRNQVRRRALLSGAAK